MRLARKKTGAGENLKNNLPVRPEMFVWRESEWALLKGVKVRVIPPNGGSLSRIRTGNE